MGTVYRAHDRVLDERVALKVLREDVATPQMARRFRSEIKLARRVSHWNVCRIHEYGEEGPLQYISMELVEGTNLKDLLRGDRRPDNDAAHDLAVQAATGLAAIHKVGVIHGDLKPQNLMLDLQGVLKVMDFGIARPAAHEGTGDSGAVGYVLGSPEYMSPEQARGQRVDFRSDIYSLGVVLYEVFSGRVPFVAETAVATLLRHLEEPVSLEDPAFPPALRPVLARTLAKDPQQRYASARDLAEALTAARGATAPQGTRRLPPVRSRPAPPRGVWLALGLGAVAAGVVSWALREGVAPPPPTPIPSHPPPSSLAPSPPLAAVAEEPAPPTTAPSRAAAPPPTPRSLPSASPPLPYPVPAAPTPVAHPETPPPEPALGAPPSPEPPEPSPQAPEAGRLLVVTTPWAEIVVDGVAVGQTPKSRFPLAPGPHQVVLTHPDYQPFHRRVTIKPGETFVLKVDLRKEGVRTRK
jgi:eukaryotic-like serine/threonine-protein kinase